MVEDINSKHVKNWIQNTFVVDKQDWSQLTSVTAYPLWSNETNMEVIFSTLKSTVLLLNAFKVGSFTTHGALCRTGILRSIMVCSMVCWKKPFFSICFLSGLWNNGEDFVLPHILTRVFHLELFTLLPFLVFFLIYISNLTNVATADCHQPKESFQNHQIGLT